MTKALKRLGGSGQPGAGRPLTKRDKARLQKSAAAAATSGGVVGGEVGPNVTTEGAAGVAGGADRAVFQRMAEIADRLVGEGELDVFTETKEDFERFAAMWMPKGATPKAAQTTGTSQGDTTAGAAAGDDDADDMFADDDEEGGAKAAKQKETAPAAPTKGQQQQADVEHSEQQAAVGHAAGVGSNQPVQASSAAATAADADASKVPADDATDYSSWPVKELKRFLQVLNGKGGALCCFDGHEGSCNPSSCARVGRKGG